MIDRYNWYQDLMVQENDGEYVRHDAHEREVVTLKSELMVARGFVQAACGRFPSGLTDSIARQAFAWLATSENKDAR